jgi:NRAMP (natural resistance-associated macrophage protein)-like metal ion transporter
MAEIDTPDALPDSSPDASPESGSVKQPERPKLLQILGPGLITGASDDDPSGIATYSQAGAQFGFDLAWTLLLSWPLMAAIQEISARIGRVTGKGIAGNLREHYPRPVVIGLVLLLFVANTINLGADLGAMAAAVRLLLGGPAWLYIAGFAVLSVGLEVFMRYSRYVSVLKWLTLSLFAYVGVALVSHVPWAQVGAHLLIPHLQFNATYITLVVAVLGTTISPYLFFWQSAAEVEEVRERDGAKPLVRAPRQARPELARIRLDTILGMGLSNLVALFIVITTAATLHAHGVTDIQTSSQAAEALRPIAGPAAFVVFAVGIIGTGLMALPVLAGSVAYALGETFGWHVGLSRRLPRARAFYATIVIATVLGVGVNFTPLDPIKALFWSAVINGLAAPPVMIMTMLVARNTAAMGKFVLPRTLKVLGWASTAAMTLAAIAMLATLGR